LVDKLELDLTEDPMNSIVQSTYNGIFPETNSVLALVAQIYFSTQHR